MSSKTTGNGTKKKLGKGKKRIKFKTYGSASANKLRHNQYKKQGRE